MSQTPTVELPIRILLVDAHAQERRLSARMLRDDVPKIRLCEVADLTALICALAEEPPLLAIVERDLGWADGVALLAQIKRNWPACYTVLFTAASLDQSIADGEPIRCDAVLRKNAGGWNALGPLALDLIAHSREAAIIARHGAPPLATSPAVEVAVAAAPTRTASPPAAPVQHDAEDAGAQTLDWFPEVEDSEAEEAARVAATLEGQGPVHQLLPAVNLESIILTAMSQLKSVIRSTRARVRAGPLPTLRMDRTDCLTLFRNLIANAVEHSGGKLPVVTIHAEHRKDYWLLSVHDNGVGIAARDVGAALQIIHPPGTQAEDEDDRGLAICNQVARRYGGSVWVQPRDGGGTSVYVALCTAESSDVQDVKVTVQYRGREMGQISVSSLSNKQQIAGRALELPRLRTALSKRSIQDVVFVDEDIVNVVA